METSQNQQLAQFIQSSEISAPQKFKDRFVYNLQNADQWWCSEKAYDEWFHVYYSEYHKFIKGIERELISETDYKEHRPRGQGIKTILLISFEGLNQLEMKCDKQTRIYHVYLQKASQQFAKQLMETKQSLIAEQQAQIAQYESMKKRGVIYEIFYKPDQNENYIGCHEGIEPKDRLKTHIYNALASLKQPLYRRIFREGLKYFDIRGIKNIDYYHPDELKDEEEKVIEELQPSLNKNYLFTCDCTTELKQEQAIFTHRQTCPEYIKKP